MSAELKARRAGRIPDERRKQAIADARETAALIEGGDVKTVVDRIRTRFPKVIERLAR